MSEETERKDYIKLRSSVRLHGRSGAKGRGLGEFPGDPVVRTPHFHCRGHGFHPWRETKIPHAAQCSQKKKKSRGLKINRSD